MVTVSDGKSKPVLMRLHLSMEVLKLQREDLEVECLLIIVLSPISRMNGVQSSHRPDALSISRALRNVSKTRIHFSRQRITISHLWTLRSAWCKSPGKRSVVWG